jgi:tRNA A-37 threonylcarbamoyl transferase component Bud32
MVESYRQQYELISTSRVEAAVHRDWVGRLGSLEGLFAAQTADREALLAGRAGQGFTSLREIAGESMYCKVYLPGRISRRLRDLLGSRRAMLEWESNCAAADLGITPATVVAAITIKQFWNCHHMVLTLPAPGTSVRDLLVERRKDPVGRDALLRLLGETISGWHELGFCHAHLNTQHLFLDMERRFTVIDFEAATFSAPAPEHLREDNLRQLRESVDKALKDSAPFTELRAAYDAERRRSVESPEAITVPRRA